MRERYEAGRERTPEVLQEKDREVILAGLAKLRAHLLAAPERFPDVVVFADVAARPFVYAVKPMIDRLAAEMGHSQPAYRFIAPQSGELAYRASLFSDDPEDEAVSLLLEDDDEGTSAQQAATAHRGARQRIVRAGEILGERERPSVLVIDDYLNEGTTLAQLHTAFLDTYHEPDFWYFPFFTNTSASVQLGDRDVVLQGVEGDERDFPSFSFMQLSGFGKRGQQKEEHRRRIGVQKDPGDAVSRRVADVTKGEIAAAKALRRAMAELGSDFLTRFS